MLTSEIHRHLSARQGSSDPGRGRHQRAVNGRIGASEQDLAISWEQVIPLEVVLGEASPCS